MPENQYPDRIRVGLANRRISKNGREYLKLWLGGMDLLFYRAPDEDSEFGEAFVVYAQERPPKGQRSDQRRYAQPEQSQQDDITAKPTYRKGPVQEAARKAESAPSEPFHDDDLPWTP